MLLSLFSDFKIRLTINSLLALLFAFCSQLLSAQEIDRDAVAEIAAELAERNGRVDADALLNAITEFQTQQIWPPSDADMVEQGSCGGESHNCIPSSEDTDTNLPQVQNVHIIYPEGGNTTVGNDFKVEWDHPEPLPDHSLYALSHYEVYLSLNDSEYERFDVAPRVTSDGAVKLKHSIRFRQRSVGTYEVQVRASYRLKSADSPSQSNTDSLNGIIGGQRGSNTRSNGYLNSSWSKGGFGDVQTPTTVQDLSSINNELHQCLLPIYGQNRALSEILFVDCRNRSLSSLLGLQYFSALRGLVVSNDLDSAGNPISNRNTFTSLSPIYELADLVSLNLSATDVAAVEITAAISTLDALETLRIANMGLAAIPDLNNPDRDALLALDISSNQISTLTPASGQSVLNIPGLSYLYADNNPLGNGNKSINLGALPSLSVLSLKNINLSVTQSLLDLPQSIAYLDLSLQKNTDDLVAFPALEYARNGIEHSGISSALLLGGNTYMSCSNVEALETWFLSNLPSCDSKKSAGGECITPFFNFELPNYCRPDEVSNFHVTRTSTNEFLFQWDAVPAVWNVQRYEILAVASTGGLSTLIVEGSQNNQYLASHLSPDFHLFAIKACVAEQCGDAGEIVTADFGLTRVTGLDVQWIDESAGRFELVWSYPTDTVNGQIVFERPEYFLIEPAAAKNGEASEFTVPVMPGDFPDQWSSDEFLTSNNTNPIYHVRACVNNHSLVRCGPRSSISVVQSVVGNLGEPSNVAVTEQGANSMRLSWTPANSSTVDYYRVNEVLTLEQGDTQPSMTNRVFFTEKESVAIDRERMASYRYRVSACRNVRDGIDECSDPSDFTPNIVMGADQQVVGINANRSGWTFDTSGDAVNGEIRLHLGLQSASSLFRRPDYFDVKVIAQPDQSLSWSHFIFYATNDHLENNRFVTPDELNLLHPNQLTVNGHPLSVYEIEVRACGTGHNCSDPVSLLIEGNNPLAVDDTLNPTVGGPNVLNPGLWWNPDLAGTGWYFYWSSGLRYPSVHENYGNTYDLIAVWGSYQIINGQWSPIWMYAELKLNDNNESFSGAMYYPQKPTCSVEDDVRDCQENLIHAADLVVQFNEDRNLASLTITHLDVPGMPEIDPSVPLQISNFEISGMCRPTEENCVFGEENPKDYLSGLWGPDTDGDGIFIDEEFIVMNWINLSLEGMMVGFYDSENRPIYALAQSCRDQDEPGMPGHGQLEANECERPGTDYLDYISDGIPGNHQNYFYAVDTGFAPTENKPDDYDITQHTFELDPANNGHFAGGGRQFSEENFNLGQAWFNFKYQTTERFATLDYGSPSDLRNIYRGASYNDIRHFIDGEENGHCIDTSANALCEIELTWFTDDYYPNAVVFYQKDQAVPQPIESLCQTVPPYDLVVERYRCVLDQLDDKSGTYRFFLINDRFPGVGWNPEEVIAVSNNLKIGAIGVANLPELEDIAPPLSSNSGQLHSIVVHDPEVGVVAASPGTSGGAATYHIPINLPPGRQGMVPGVALSYNSRGGNGVAGMGWSLATGSSIHRCPMTVAQDGNTIGVQYAETDRLCLDGQRLIRVNGGDYWDNNGEYRTEIDAYARIRMLGGSGQEANALGVGLQFTVEGKDNIYREYGAAVSSQVHPTGAVGATLPAVVSSWMLNLEEDPAGNRVDYQYINFGDGELLLSQIRYTGFGEELGNRAVKFDYQDRIANSDAGSVRDNAESWQAGYFTRQTKRLTTITTCLDVNSCTADGRVREYSLDYIASNATQRLLLSQVTECAYLDGVAECLRPTTFEWNSIQPHYSFEKLADSGGAYIDSSGFEYDGAEGWGQNDFAAPDIDILGDYNGDGVREMRMSIDGKAYLVGVNANGDILGKMRLSNGVAAALTSYRYRGDQDFNDDGRSDFLVAIPNETTPSDPDDYVYAIAQWKAGGTWSDCESQSESCNLNMMFDVRPTDVTTNIIEGQEGPGVGDPDDNNDENLVIRLPANTPHIADFNGDGQKDFLILGENNQLQLYINVESDAAVRTQTTASIPFAGPFIVESPQFESNGSGSSLLTYRQPQLSDFDGDGAVDILIQADPSSTIDPRDQINAGMAAVVFNDLQRSSVTITEGMPSDALTAYFDDIRVVSDFIERLPDNVSYPQIDLAFDPLLNYYLPVDINGDGLQDFVYMDGGGSGVCLTVTNADGTHPNRSWFYQLNTGHRDHLFTAQVDTNSCVGIERVSGAIGIPSPTYAGLTQTVDWNNDGRGDLMVPRQIHEAVCYLPGQFASNEEAVSYCPAQPDGSGWEQLTCPQGSDVCDLYRSGKGSQDRSTYKMSVLEFTADENGVYRIEERTSDETGLVSARGMRGDDLFGDGLNNVYGAVGCIESPVIGPNGPSLSNRCDITPLAGQYPYSHLFGGLSDAGRGYYQNRLQVAFPQFALDLLSLAEDGFNNETLWEYLPLSAERVSSETSMPLYSLPDRDSGDSLYDYQSEHYFYFQSSMYVVSKMETTNGLVANGEDQTNRTYYGYEEAVFNNQGRGFQGFRKILSEDHIRTPDASLDNPANDLRTVSFFHQVFPLAGRLYKSVVFPADTPLSAPESQALSVSATSWACRDELGALVVECGIATDTAPSSQEANVYQVLVSDTHTISREPNTGENYNSSSSFNRSYDAYGNLLAETTQSGDYIGSMLFPALIQQQQSSYEYTNNTSSWWLGRLDRQVSTSTVTYSRDLALNESGFADTQASKTTTQVMSWNSILRKPSCVLNVAADYSDTCSSTPSGVQFSRIRTQYEATGIPSAMYGNPTRITIAANDPSQDSGLIEERVTSTSYSNDGYFVASVSNALGHETQTTVEPREGNPIEMIDTNGQRVRMEYDAFGREVRNWFPRVAHADFDDTDNHYAPRTSMGYQLASDSSCQVAGLNIAEAVYCVRQHTDGAPQQLQLIDRLNRTWASATSGFNNEGTGRRWSVAQNQYNARGQMAKEAAPRYLGDTVYWTSYTYDVLARPVQKTQPRHAGAGATVPVDDLLTYYAHDGLQTRITVGDRIPNDTNTCKTASAGDDLSSMFCVERVYSSGGQLLRTRDAHGEWTEYRHDSQGYPAFIRDVEFNRIYAEYNAFGQRLAMNDPNQGDWVFSYNGLGELVNQTDARNINIRFTYDRLGRLTERDAGQGQFQRVVDRWTYDNDASVSGNRTVRGLLGREVRDLMIGGTNQAPLFQRIYDRRHRYDSDLRTAGHSTTVNPRQAADPKTYLATVQNDPYFARPFAMTWPGQHIRLYNAYDDQGYLVTEGHSEHFERSDEFLRRVLSMSPVGQVEKERYGNGSEQFFAYHPSTWQMRTVSAGVPASAGVQPQPYFDIDYRYDLYGNLSQQLKAWQASNGSDAQWVQEDFSYDHLHRLLQSQRYRGQGQAGHGASTADTITYQYTPNGNLLSKSDYADGYSYQANQVQSVNPILAPTQYYDYDPNGNMERVYQNQNGQAVNLKQINYDPYNKPTKIDDQAKGRVLEFSYGSNDQRFYQLKDLNGDYTVYIDKLYEAYGDGNSSQDTGAKLYIGDYAVYDLDLDPITGEGEANLQYLYRDRLGSVVSVADANGGLIDSAGRGFDPFGKPREDDWRDSDGQNGETPTQPGDLNRNDLTTRGFTGHEHLNETDLIHMNGRVYDYNLGRFLSVDPFIQFPENSQSMNAYSYILNNPLSGTDPTGYTTEAPDVSQSGTGNSSGGNSAADQAKEGRGSRRRNVTGSRVRKETVVTATFDNGQQVMLSASEFGVSFSGSTSLPTTDMNSGGNGEMSEAGMPSMRSQLNIDVEQGDQSNSLVVPKAYSVSNSTRLQEPIHSSQTRADILEDALDRLESQIRYSKGFADEETRQYYLDLLMDAKIRNNSAREGISSALAKIEAGVIEVFGKAFRRNVYERGNRRSLESSTSVAIKLSMILAHELRHLTPLNDGLSDRQQSLRAILSAKEHSRNPSEIDADEFARILFSRKEEDFGRIGMDNTFER